MCWSKTAVITLIVSCVSMLFRSVAAFITLTLIKVRLFKLCISTCRPGNAELQFYWEHSSSVWVQICSIITFFGLILQVANMSCSDLWPPCNEMSLLWELKVPLMCLCMKWTRPLETMLLLKFFMETFTQNKLFYNSLIIQQMIYQKTEHQVFSFYFNLKIHFYDSVYEASHQNSSGWTASMLLRGGNVNHTECKNCDWSEDFSFVLDQIQSIKNRFHN